MPLSIQQLRHERDVAKRRQQAYYRLFRDAQTRYEYLARRTDAIYDQYPSDHVLHRIRRRRLLRMLREDSGHPTDVYDEMKDYWRLWLEEKHRVQALIRLIRARS